MRYKFCTVLVFVSFSYTLMAQPKTDKQLSQTFDTMLANVFKPDGPGATIIVSRKGEVIYKKGFGMADLELNVPVQPDMIFRIGSITKQFTAVAILQLVEQGKLSLQDEIKKFIPDYPAHDLKITVEHLLTHTSGIKSYTSMKDFQTMMRKDMKPMEIIDVFKNEPMDFTPAVKWTYNNSGYILLGYIIEKVSGKTYEQYVKEHLFTPAGMINSGYGSENRIIKNRAKGYQKSKDDYENADYLSMTLPYSAGSLISNVEDLWKWNRAVHSYKLVSKASLDKAFTDFKLSDGKSTNYGYGWFLSNVQDSKTIEHSGGINGFLSDAIYLPAQDIFVAILSNCTCNPVEDLAIKIAALTMGKPYDRKEIVITDAVAKEYAGVYEKADGEQRIIAVTGNKLTSQRGSGNALNIRLYEKDKFFFDNYLHTLHFIRNSAGQIEKLKYISRNEQSDWTKTNKPAPSATAEPKVDKAILNTYVGEYELAPNFIITISLEGDKIMAQATGQGKNEIFPESATRFFLKVVDAQLEFFKGADNKITHLVLYQDGQKIEGKKIK